MGEAVVEVLGERVRGAREGRGGWGQMHITEPLGLGCDERITGELAFDGEDLGGVGEAVVEVVGARVRAACEGEGGWGQIHKTESLGLGFGKRMAGELIF